MRLIPRIGAVSSRRGLLARQRFLIGLMCSCMATLAIVCTGLFLAQSSELRSLAVIDGETRHRAHSTLIEEVFGSTERDTAWSEVSELLRQIAVTNQDAEVRVISQTGRVVASSHQEGGEAHDESGEVHDDVVTSVGDPDQVIFAQSEHDGREVFEYQSLIELDGVPYTFEVAYEPVVLSKQIDALRKTSLEAFGLGTIVAFPLLYLLGGRRLASRYNTAAGEATRDGLTGLENHRAFQEALAQEVAEAQRFNQALCLALVDVDDFKRVNDHGGHRRGDEVLVALAEALRTTRAVDRAFRVGGDEFALLLPRTGQHAAALVIERLQASVRRRLGDVTVSIGVASFGADADVAVLRDQADSALYAAKHRGRNQTVLYDDLDRPTHVRAAPSPVEGTPEHKPPTRLPRASA